ncbi:MAG: hypothetical protein ACW98U_08970 [Candidatus Thorarchaeota archaeon]|jgi:2-phosphoglycerate kinase
MKLRIKDTNVPYPLSVIKGRLSLSGLPDMRISEIMREVVGKMESSNNPTEETLLSFVQEFLESNGQNVREDFETLTRYERMRADDIEIPPVVVILEGASATGKSVIALKIVHDLVATRYISSDTVRQVLRSTLKEEEFPEIFGHTYQAHLHRQTGPSELDPVVRGYLAQCEVITPRIREMIQRILEEGTTGVIEGVHIIPGELKEWSPSIIEVLINPNDETHKSMFMSKHNAAKLRTVSENTTTREREYEGTRAIQEYMSKLAKSANVPLVEMNNFEDATSAISKIIVESVRMLIAEY